MNSAHRDPQPDDLGAALLDDVLRRHHVAERLRHLAPFEVDPGTRVSGPCLNGGRPRVAQHRPAASSETSLDADRSPRDTCPPARSSSGRRGSTASWLEPESNQTSRMSRLALERACRRTTGTSDLRAGTPRWAARTTRRRRTRRTPTPPARRAPASATPRRTSVQSSAGIGTPQVRWREMHQSGRVSIICPIRVSPNAGSQRVAWSSSAPPGLCHEGRRRPSR